jgi:hypothetical protein
MVGRICESVSGRGRVEGSRFENCKCPRWVDAVEKVPNSVATNLPANRNTRRLFADMPPGQLPKSPASSSLCDASPYIFIRSPRPRLGKFVFSNAKRLFRQHRSSRHFRRRRLLPVVPDVVRESEHVSKVQVFLDDTDEIFLGRRHALQCLTGLNPRPTFHRTERVLVERRSRRGSATKQPSEQVSDQ